MPSLADVKLPQSDKDAAIDTQVKRLRTLSAKFVESNSEALNALGDLLDDVAEELDKTTSGAEGDASITEEIQTAVSAAKVS